MSEPKPLPALAITHVLAPTDFSPSADRALGAAVQLAEAFGARLTCLHVIDADFEAAALAYGIRPPFTEYAEQQERAAVEQLDELIAGFDALDVASLVTRGTASVEIVRTARAEACDIIVIGTHGQSALRHMLFGSTAERVLRRAHCPVLSVPTPSDEDPR